ncbi:UPF0182 family protein [Virgibacillus soli]|uniref:UPF0182 family membrane protein n=1 Tax=Paracerasibacillus soli TaxID=480284 RepID=UPI0035E54114
MNFDYNRKTIDINKLKRWKKIGNKIAITFGILFFLLVVGWPALQWATEYIWMDSLGFGNVYVTILQSKILLGVIGFILFSFTTYIMLFWIRHAYIRHFEPKQLPPVILNRKISNLIMVAVAIFLGFVGSMIIQGIGWEPALKLLNYATFGKTDPYFNMDISFYMFILPFLQFILYVLLGLSIFFLLLEIGAYSVFHMYKKSRTAQLHMGITLGVIGLLLAGIHVLAPYGTLLTDQVNIFQKSVVHGLSFTDKLINIPKAYLLAAVALIGAIWMIVSLYSGKLEAMLLPIIAYVGLVILGQGASVVVQNFVVSPNEFTREKPFLEQNLKFTRAAYNLDKIQEKEHPGNESLTGEMVERNNLTIDNVRLNDSRPLLDIYNQIQTFRTYYRFNDMDIDRYKINGNYEQVFIGARELSTDDLPAQAKTWVNKNLRYTHGYGVAMSHVNKVTSQGQPEYMMKNIPSEGEFDITRPQIYFGEEPYPNVIVNSKVDEFDYPTGGDNATHRFEAKSGIPLKGLNKLLFAIDSGSFRMLVSDQLTTDSQLLKTRNIMDRVKKIAPFFEYDEDPYIVIRDDGTLVWIMDAYVKAENYPYAEPYERNESYIRNSVKAVVDAYTGEVTFYVADPDDPLLQTYANIFPELLTYEIPEDIKDHFRYPEKLFKTQAKMYGTYHMSNLEVFYNREDYWQFPTEKYFDKDIEMEPYYITMKLPEYDEEEFVLMLPYTPKKRQNMISWIGVRNDGEHYGEMFVYRFPKQKNIYGPQQIENRINQDSVISQQLNLWAQGGSEVIRGNLLAIPIEDTVLYVEPVYIESSNETSLPEVKQVIMAYGDHIVMEETFEKSLDKILEVINPGKKTEDKTESDKPDTEEKEDTGKDKPSQPLLDADELLQEIGDKFTAYREALANGNWEKAGKIMEDIEAILEDTKK